MHRNGKWKQICLTCYTYADDENAFFVATGLCIEEIALTHHPGPQQLDPWFQVVRYRC